MTRHRRRTKEPPAHSTAKTALPRRVAQGPCGRRSARRWRQRHRFPAPMTISWTKRKRLPHAAPRRGCVRTGPCVSRHVEAIVSGSPPEIEAGEHDDPLVLIEIEQAKWGIDAEPLGVLRQRQFDRGARPSDMWASMQAYLVEKQATHEQPDVALRLGVQPQQLTISTAGGHLAIREPVTPSSQYGAKLPGVCPPRSPTEAQLGRRGTRSAASAGLRRWASR